jgi:hypothetical protein
VSRPWGSGCARRLPRFSTPGGDCLAQHFNTVAGAAPDFTGFPFFLSTNRGQAPSAALTIPDLEGVDQTPSQVSVRCVFLHAPRKPQLEFRRRSRHAGSCTYTDLALLGIGVDLDLTQAIDASSKAVRPLRHHDPRPQWSLLADAKHAGPDSTGAHGDGDSHHQAENSTSTTDACTEDRAWQATGRR